jgi:hypothetical protein
MVISALLSFLGGSAFRMIWGEISAWATRKQEHDQEIARLTIQSTIEAERHARDLERIRLQKELEVQQVQVVGDVEVSKLEAAAFVEAMKAANKPTGVKWIDGWIGAVRPAAATLALMLWMLKLWQAGFVMGEWDQELVGAILGFFFADRSLSKRGK